MIPRRTWPMATILIAASALAGCVQYRPQGPLLNYTGAARTFVSTSMAPKSVRVVDARTDEAFFEVDIPVGKQLVVEFLPDDGDDPVYTPDIMRWSIMDIGTQTGRLHNQMSVPSAAARVIEVTMRDGPAYADEPPRPELRTDQAYDRPEWWTPEGGPLPETGSGLDIYDR